MKFLSKFLSKFLILLIILSGAFGVVPEPASAGGLLDKIVSPFGKKPQPQPPPPAERITCIAGSDPRDLRLHQQILGGPASDLDFLKSWRTCRSATLDFLKTASGPQCFVATPGQPTNRGPITSARDIVCSTVNTVHRGISHACIADALNRVPNIVHGFAPSANDKTSMALCAPDQGGERLVPGNSVPCMSLQYIDYVHFAFNAALQCMNLNDSETPQGTFPESLFIFSQINNESGFGTFLASRAGKGAGQLTSIAVKEMIGKFPNGTDHEGAAYMKSIAAYEPSCAMFKTAMAEQPAHANSCELISPVNGIARSFLLAAGLYRYYREGTKESAKSILEAHHITKEKCGKNFIDMRNYLALFAYSGAGPHGASMAFNKIASKITCNTTLAQFAPLLNRTAPYMRAVQIKLAEALWAAPAPINKGGPSDPTVRATQQLANERAATMPIVDLFGLAQQVKSCVEK